ncbi:hypothetical protein Baya_3821 [Bagarius yarrelli]|uniref:Uncharacterized protein n=1 Tax=Bagarius yarrelli TaxID=175774 RepID=A0A556TT39_BAGYA|nr:hypothetical protein Baya_3821 [Bagarius yarrelli]
MIIANRIKSLVMGCHALEPSITHTIINRTRVYTQLCVSTDGKQQQPENLAKQMIDDCYMLFRSTETYCPDSQAAPS